MTNSVPNPRIALSTAGSIEEADRLARALVEGRFAACVNLVAGVTSIYRWQGSVESASEVLLIVKTTAENLAAAEAELRRLHSYEVPEWLVLEVASGSHPYLNWLTASTGRETGS